LIVARSSRERAHQWKTLDGERAHERMTAFGADSGRRQGGSRLGSLTVNPKAFGSQAGANAAKKGGRAVKHARCCSLLLAESHLTRPLFGSLIRRIELLPLLGIGQPTTERTMATSGPRDGKVSEASIGEATIRSLGTLQRGRTGACGDRWVAPTAENSTAHGELLFILGQTYVIARAGGQPGNSGSKLPCALS
jgi:hypothetical protein